MTKEEVIAVLEDINQGIENRMIFVGEMSRGDQILMNAIKDNITIILPSIEKSMCKDDNKNK